MVTTVREPGSPWEMPRNPGGLWLPGHAQPLALEGSESAGSNPRGPGRVAGPASLHCPAGPFHSDPLRLMTPDYLLQFHLSFSSSCIVQSDGCT